MIKQSLKPHQLAAKSIQRLIEKNSVNKPDRIRTIEQVLKKTRGYVFKMPAKGQSVIALMSGGLDTTVVIAMLLEHFQLQVYPLVVNRQLLHSGKTNQAIKFFTTYFSQRYPDQFHLPKTVESLIPPKEFKKVISEHENDILFKKIRRGVPLQPSVYAHLAFFYANHLELTKSVSPRTIFGGWLPSNSEWYQYESFQSLRSIMLHLCLMTNDFDWQFTGLAMEKELGFYFDKNTLVKIGAEIGLPLERTWTCYRGNMYQCGDCPPCWTRRKAFKSAGVVDTTIYRSEDIFDFKPKLVRLVKKLKL